ncbi:hypothetical protein HPB48_018265 [Haemaphysalis longicornis]|uniref:Tick transposon n=1 Tax=Haemaphysalis longicornis TaxID=44386 RepID=A0A9J6FYS8_HAELO|nr:hypothetical protein HPB48_018265 [Haemaphysalis longicornis]
MLINSFFVIQIALWRSGFVARWDDYGRRLAHASPPAASVVNGFSRQLSPNPFHSVASRYQRVDTVTSPELPRLDYKYCSHPDAPFSGLGCTETGRMLINSFFVIQVGVKYQTYSIRDNSVTLTVLPSPHFLVTMMFDCISVIKLLLLTSGDVELNPGPSSASESDSEAMTTRQMLEKILKEQTKTTQTLKELTKNLKHVETTVANIQERINAIETDMGRLTKCEEQIAEFEETCQRTSKQVQDIVAKIDDLENRSRRNNLVIYGVTEGPREDTQSLEQKVKKDIFKDILGIDVASIERIHRVGYPQSGRQRPVVLRLYNFAEKYKILSCCNKLKGFVA